MEKEARSLDRWRTATLLVGGTILLIWGFSQVAAGWRQYVLEEQSGRELAERATEGELDQASTVALFRQAKFWKNALPPDYEKSASCLSKALQLAPANSNLWMELALVRMYQGREDEAAAALKQADQLDPAGPEKRLRSLELWFALGEEEEGLALASRLVRLNSPLGRQTLNVLLSQGVSSETAFQALYQEELSQADKDYLERLFASRDKDAWEKVRNHLGADGSAESSPDSNLP